MHNPARWILFVAAALLSFSSVARGQFTTVIHVPPQTAPSQLDSNTQLNLYDGGSISSGSSNLNVGAPNGSSINVEFNMFGGAVIRDLSAYAGITLNFSGGAAYDVFARTGSRINVSNEAFVQLLRALSGSTVNVAGGAVGFVQVEGGSTVRVSGGVLRPGINVAPFATGAFTLVGAQFAINGQPVQGLVNVGDRVSPANLPTGSVLTGVLADGTPVIVSSLRQDALRAFTLELANLPTAQPQVVAGDNPLLRGVRGGQTLTVNDDAVVRGGFRAGPSSVIDVLSGGLIGSELEAAYATVSVSGGRIEGGFNAFGSTVVNLTSGQIDSQLIAHPGSVLNVSGGQLGNSFSIVGGTLNLFGGSAGNSGRASAGGRVNVTGGTLGTSFQAQSGSTVSISGGKVGRQFAALTGSTVEVSGGSIGERFEVNGGQVTLLGGEFRLNGQPIAGLNSVGDIVPVPVVSPNTDILSGVFADGTPFVFTFHDLDVARGPSARLRLANIAPVGPALITVPTDPVSLGIRGGQTLRVAAGGIVGDDFMAGPGAVVELETGGSIGNRLEASGATITIDGGTLGSTPDAFLGSTINLNSGAIGSSLRIFDDSVLNVSGGSIGTGLRILTGGRANVTDGILTSMNVEAGAEATFTGGAVNSFGARNGSVVHFTGGTFGEFFDSDTGSSVALTGGEFRLNGQPINGLTAVGNSAQIDLTNDAVLTGVLADGSSFAVTSRDGDTIANGTLRLTVAALPAPVAKQIVASMDDVPVSIRRDETLIMGQGTTLRSNFAAGPGSTLIVHAGASVGQYLEALGAEILLQGGSIGNNMDAFDGSEVRISAGTVDSSFQVYDSDVHISGGSIGSSFEVFEGSNVTVTGGSIDRIARFMPNSALAISGGVISENLTATDAAITISGGEVGSSFKALAGTVVEMSNGTLGFSTEFDSSTLRLSGGSVASGLSADHGSVIEVFGGQLGDGADIFNISRLTVTGGIVGASLFAGSGARIEISGGEIGPEFQSQQAEVSISGGHVGEEFGARDTVLNVSAGSIGDFSFASESSEVSMSGGNVGRDFGLHGTSALTKTGGVIGESFGVSSSAVANLQGGVVGPSMQIFSSATVNLSGGAVGREIQTETGTHLHVHGGEFQINGQPVAGLQNPGSSVQLNVPAGSLLTGTLADGTPVALGTTRNDNLATGTLTLRRTALPAVGPAVIVAATDPVPKGLRSGQTLIVGSGGVVGDYFRAGVGSALQLSAGGIVGDQLEAAGAAVDITGGQIGDDLLALRGTTLNLS